MLNYSQVTLDLIEITHFTRVDIPICSSLLPYRSVCFAENVEIVVGIFVDKRTNSKILPGEFLKECYDFNITV